MKWITPAKSPDLSKLNNGQRYVPGDAVTPDIFNALNESIIYAKNKGRPVPSQHSTQRYTELTSAYTRYFDEVFWTNNGYIRPNGTYARVLPTKNATVDETVFSDVGNLQPAVLNDANKTKVIFYRVGGVVDGAYTYELRVRTSINNTDGNPVTLRKLSRAASATVPYIGLYEPFYIDGYLFWSEQHPSIMGAQRIMRAQVNADSLSLENMGVAIDYVLEDDMGVVQSCRPGFASIIKLQDDSYMMIFESNVDNANPDLDYPYVIQYSYSKDLATWTFPKILFRAKGELVNAPYISLTGTGRVAISYHTTKGRTGLKDGVSIHNKVFRVQISKEPILYHQVLTSDDFDEMPTPRAAANEWTGGWGSLFIRNARLQSVYTRGHIEMQNGVTKSVQDGLFVDSFEKTPFVESDWPERPRASAINNGNEYNEGDGVTASDINLILDTARVHKAQYAQLAPPAISFVDGTKIKIVSPAYNDTWGIITFIIIDNTTTSDQVSIGTSGIGYYTIPSGYRRPGTHFQMYFSSEYFNHSERSNTIVYPDS